MLSALLMLRRFALASRYALREEDFGRILAAATTLDPPERPGDQQVDFGGFVARLGTSLQSKHHGGHLRHPPP